MGYGLRDRQGKNRRQLSGHCGQGCGNRKLDDMAAGLPELHYSAYLYFHEITDFKRISHRHLSSRLIVLQNIHFPSSFNKVLNLAAGVGRKAST